MAELKVRSDSLRPGGRIRRLLIATAVALGACAAIPLRPKPPTITLSGLRLEGISLTRVDFGLDLDVYNPNGYALELGDLKVELELLGITVATGVSKQTEFELPAEKPASVALVFQMPLDRLAQLLKSLATASPRDYDYQLIGSARWGDSPTRIAFERRGRLHALREFDRLMHLLQSR